MNNYRERVLINRETRSSSHEQGTRPQTIQSKGEHFPYLMCVMASRRMENLREQEHTYVK